MYGVGAQFPQPNKYTTSSLMQQNNTNLLGNPQFQTAAAIPNFNTTAPGSSFQSPAIANMIKALKGGT